MRKEIHFYAANQVLNDKCEYIIDSIALIKIV